MPLLGLSTGEAALAAWSSGGGILTKDANNPWFLENTPFATYCIIRDANHFKIDEDEGVPIDTLVRNALQYWKDDFDKARINDTSFSQIATQKFVEVSCKDNADIQFQFGYLSPAQLDEMQKRDIDPQEFVSIAVRTDYDQVNLKGKGFVYLAADSGALRPNSDKMVAYPWEEFKGAFTYKVLVHELGHVFGIQHHGHNVYLHNADSVSLMAENYPEKILEKSPYRRDGGFLLPSFLKYKQPPASSWEIKCYNNWQIANTFYDLKSDDGCYLEEIRDGRLEVFTTSGSGAKTLVGVADLMLARTQYDFPVHVWLPRIQTVYPTEKKRSRIAAHRHHEYFKGVYKSLSGSVEREISVVRSPIAA